MPRTGKGAKPNRTDMNQAAPTGKDREYGANAADQAALDQQPMGPQPSAAPAGGEQPILPGQLGSLTAPTNRPGEPITNGIDLGPGRGSDARMMAPQTAYKTPLQRAATMTGNPRLRQLLERTNG